MSAPRLSIVTPSLNQAAFLERTLRSVLDQGYPNLEYIVVDGGSTDGSVDILERYADRLAHWESRPDAGQSAAINKGLKRATGDVLAFINSDDYYLPGAFDQAMHGFAEGPDVEWVVGGCRYLRPDGSIETELRPRAPHWSRERLIRSRWYAPQASSFWRRSVFERLGWFREDLHFVLDTEFGIRIALAGVRPLPVDAVLAVRFVHDDAKSAEPERFDAEWSAVERDFLSELTVWDRALYNATGRAARGVIEQRWKSRRATQQAA